MKRKLAICLFLFVCSHSLAQNYKVTDISALGFGGSTSLALAINNSGQVTGWSTTPNGITHSFLYSQGNLQNLDPNNSAGYGINSLGHVVGQANQPGVPSSHAFLYSNGVLQNLGQNSTAALGVNSIDQVVGYTTNGPLEIQHAFLYKDGILQDIHPLNQGETSRSQALGINSKGNIVGWLLPVGSSDYVGCMSTDGGPMQSMEIPGLSLPTAINDVDQVVGRTVINGHNHAFIWQNGNIQDLGTAGWEHSTAFAINNFGDVVGRLDNPSVCCPPAIHAFLYKNGTMQDLNNYINPASGWIMIAAFGINDKGQIVGYGRKVGTFSQQAVLLSPIVPGDVNEDFVVNIDDLLLVINSWGLCPPPCPADIAPPGGNGKIDVDDLTAVINNWTP